MSIDVSVYAGLFLTALLAATVLPAQSEFLLVGLLLAGAQPAWALVVVASVGNTLGSAVNWLIGNRFVHLLQGRWFGQETKHMKKAQQWYHTYGKWSLLLSWAPFIGDPLTLIAGILKEPFRPFLAIVCFAKTARYVLVAVATLKGVSIAEYLGWQ